MARDLVMLSWIPLLVSLCYAAIVLELTVLHTPSVASSRSLWSGGKFHLRYHTEPFRRLFRMSRAQKLVRFGLPLLVVYAVFAFPLIAVWMRSDPLGDYLYDLRPWIGIPAFALMLAGRVLTMVSAVTMRGAHDRPERNGRLEIRGVFRWSRNPGLVGMYMMFAGFWLVIPSLTFLLGIAVYCIHMHFKVRIEEDFLAQRFGEVYRDYARQTPRYVL